MIENFNEIIQNKDFEKVGTLTVIQRKNFLNEVICSYDLTGLTFAYLTFVDCNFINMDFRYATFINCDFTNCNFTETIFLKSELDTCSFKNSKIAKSQLARANFIESKFTDCQFDKIDVAGVVFNKCELIHPKFYKVRFLKSVTLSKSKIWDSKQCIEVDTFDDVSKIVDELQD